MYKKNLNFIISLFLFLSEFSPCKAVLDGRNTAIVVDTHYTFTNFEWARGFVKFKNGFDVPANGTIFLGVYTEVSGQMVFLNNRSTIILEDTLSIDKASGFSGSGFIKTNNHWIYYRDNMSVNSPLFITDQLIMDGLSRGILTFNTGSTPTFTLLNSNNIYLFNSYIQSIFISTDPFSFRVANRTCTLQDITLSGRLGTFDTLFIANKCSFGGRNQTFTYGNRVNIYANSELTIRKGCTLNTPLVAFFDSLATLILINATATTNALQATGQIIVQGKSRISSPNSSPVSLHQNTSLQIANGSLLTIDPNTRLLVN